MIVDVRGEGGGITVVVILCECRALLAKEAVHQNPVQFVPEKGAQVGICRMLPHGADRFRILFAEPVCHQIMLDAVAQIDREMVVRRDLVHGKLLFAQRIEVPLRIVHHEIGEVLRRKCAAPLRIDDEAHVTLGETVEQGFCIVFDLVFEFVLVKRDDLIEVDVIPVGENADVAAALFDLTADEQGTAECGALSVGRSAVNRVSPAEPSVVLDWQTCELFQQADRPVMLLCILVDVPVARQGDCKLGTFEFALRKLCGHVHAVRAHPEGDEHIVAALLGRLDNADVQMDVRRDDLVKDVRIRAEVRLDVALDGVQFFLSIDLCGHWGFLFMRSIISTNFFHRVLLYD